MTRLSNKAKANKLADICEPHVKTLLLATAVAQLERERVDKIQREVLAQTVYLVDQRHVDRGRPDERITDPKLSFLMYDDDAKEYHAKLNAIHLANGFEDAAKGFCPALVAEHLQTQAEWALIEAAEEFFPDCTNDRLLCGTKDLGGLEARRKYLDLLIGLVVNRPGFSMPFTKATPRVAKATPNVASSARCGDREF